MTNIKKLKVNKFRGIKNEEILIGEQLTAIMGQNGAQKSTVLGMLAQPFNFTTHKSILNDTFQTKFGDIFNFSEDHDEIGEHQYSIELFNDSILKNQLRNDKSSIKVTSRKRTGTSCLFIFDIQEKEFNDYRKESFSGLIQTYRHVKEEIYSEDIKIRKMAKLHKENELTLKDLLIHYKNNKVEQIYKSSEDNSDPNKINLIIELKADSSHLRFVAGDSNQSGDGNLNLPVIYLGLSRVVPLGEVDRDNITQLNIERIKKYESLIAEKSKNILLDYDSPEYKATPLNVTDTSIKGTRMGIHTDKYSPITMSAGQDNISKILSAIYSFKDLQEELGDEYCGGLLLIDELDATLYPGAQKELIAFFKQVSKQLQIQIIFTTHSIHVLDEMYSEEHKDKFSVNYLWRTGSQIINDPTKTPESIYYDIVVESENTSKIPCLCEDEYTVNMLKALIEESDEFKVDTFEFIAAEASFTTLKKLISIDNKYMRQNIYVIDGDHPEIIDFYNEEKIIHSGVSLPVDAPEVVISNFITDEIPHNHPLFVGHEYNKQQLMRDYKRNHSTKEKDRAKEFIKKQEKTRKRIFKNNCEELFNIWANWFKENHNEEYNVFINQLKYAYETAINNIEKKI